MQATIRPLILISVISAAAVLIVPQTIIITLPLALLAGGLHRAHRFATAGLLAMIQVAAFLLATDAQQLEAGIGPEESGAEVGPVLEGPAVSPS